MQRAMPIPPPIHRVARAFLAFFLCISCNNVTRMRQPEAPIGWPRAIAPPFMLVLFVSNPSSLMTAMDWAAKASFASIRSSSSIDQPAFFRAFFVAGMGPVPIIDGSTPAVAHEAILAIGFMPLFSASDLCISKTAAAPSFSPEALPAVTVPSFLKAGLRLARDSMVAPKRGCSSFSIIISPLRVFCVMGIISSLNFPEFMAASAFNWEFRANSSCSSRLILYFSAIFSAVMPIW